MIFIRRLLVALSAMFLMATVDDRVCAAEPEDVSPELSEEAMEENLVEDASFEMDPLFLEDEEPLPEDSDAELMDGMDGTEVDDIPPAAPLFYDPALLPGEQDSLLFEEEVNPSLFSEEEPAEEFVPSLFLGSRSNFPRIAYPTVDELEFRSEWAAVPFRAPGFEFRDLAAEYPEHTLDEAGPLQYGAGVGVGWLYDDGYNRSETRSDNSGYVRGNLYLALEPTIPKMEISLKYSVGLNYFFDESFRSSRNNNLFSQGGEMDVLYKNGGFEAYLRTNFTIGEGYQVESGERTRRIRVKGATGISYVRRGISEVGTDLFFETSSYDNSTLVDIGDWSVRTFADKIISAKTRVGVVGTFGVDGQRPNRNTTVDGIPVSNSEFDGLFWDMRLQGFWEPVEEILTLKGGVGVGQRESRLRTSAIGDRRGRRETRFVYDLSANYSPTPRISLRADVALRRSFSQPDVSVTASAVTASRISMALSGYRRVRKSSSRLGEEYAPLGAAVSISRPIGRYLSLRFNGGIERRQFIDEQTGSTTDGNEGNFYFAGATLGWRVVRNLTFDVFYRYSRRSNDSSSGDDSRNTGGVGLFYTF